MPKSDNQKLKVLYILDYLKRYSRWDHPVTASQLLEMLESHGIACERKTIYADIAALQDYGADIITSRGKGGGYYLASRNFEATELKLLINAVASSRFLTKRKSRELVKKLSEECTIYEAGLVRQDVMVNGRVKSMNESIYYNIDAIQDAIQSDRQISFRYFDRGLEGQVVYRPGEYHASPYTLYQDNENCYLLARSDRHGATHYRVDRMSHILATEEKREPCPEFTGRALQRYTRRLFQMYGGEAVQVKLRFHRSMANAVFDRFGQETMLFPDGEEHFVCTVDVALSDLFLSWVIGFGDKAQILSPQRVIDRCRELCHTVLAQCGEATSE